MAAKFKIGDEVITKRNNIGTVKSIYKCNFSSHYNVYEVFFGPPYNSYHEYYASELDKYINTIDDLL